MNDHNEKLKLTQLPDRSTTAGGSGCASDTDALPSRLIQACSDRQDANLRRFAARLLAKFAEINNRLSRIEHHRR